MPSPKQVDKAVSKTTKSVDPHEVARKMNDKMGKPADMGKGRGPMRDSGSMLPPSKTMTPKKGK